MKVTGAVTALMLAAVLTCWCDGAQAYRPFDGTDAAVADTGEVEIELGPVEYLREEAERTRHDPEVSNPGKSRAGMLGATAPTSDCGRTRS